MRNSCRRFTYILTIAIFLSTPLFADEGMWLLTALDKLSMKELKARGLKLSPKDIYNPNGPSLKDAIVLLGGGTGEFVSQDGLMLTNHHVAYGALQSNSNPEHDYIKNGFHAQTREEELSARNYTASIVEEMRDVTTEILAQIKPEMSAADRDTAIRRTSDSMTKAAVNSDKDRRAIVQEMNNGERYVLFVTHVIRDVRLVYSPPLSIGNYGGEVDNWMWPRHTGDFSFMRAYIAKDGSSAEYSKDNVPYKPKTFLKISKSGTKPNDFVMIMGYPGRTFRYRTSYEVQFDQDINFPMFIKMVKANIDALESIRKKDKATELKYASRVKGLYNGYKNRKGMVEGLRKLKLVHMKADVEKAFIEWLNKNSEMNKKYADILPTYQNNVAELSAIASKQIAWLWLGRSGTLLSQALTIAKWQAEQLKPDAQREEGYHQKDSSSIKSRLLQKVDDIDLEEAMLTNVLSAAASIDQADRLTSVASVVQVTNQTGSGEQIKNVIHEMITKTTLASLQERMKFLSVSPAEFSSVHDPLLDFAKNLDYESSKFLTRYGDLMKSLDRLRGRWIEAIGVWKKSYLYPDANRTLRLTYGTVKSYTPRDAMSYQPYTRLKGVIEKDMGEEPFDVPVKLNELSEKKDFGDYADKSLGDVPVAFLSNTDITGGNSGSPVLNGKGEIVGCAFDGVYEGLLSDFKYDESYSRTISVDSRYILFILDKFSKAKSVLDELTIVK